MTPAQIKEHVKEWRQLGDILIKRDWDSIGVNGQKRKRKGKEKEKLPEKKKQKEEEEERFFIFSNDFLSNIMQMPAELQYPILEQMLMPKFLDNSVDNIKRLPHAIMEIRKLDMIFNHFVTTKNCGSVLLSKRIQMHMYATWLQHPMSSFRVGNRIFHGEPFSAPEFQELRLVELIKMNRLVFHLWYRSFLVNVLFNWYTTETTYHVFAAQMEGLTTHREASILKNHWPGTIEVMEEGLWNIVYYQFAGVGRANLLGIKKKNIPTDSLSLSASHGFHPKLKFLLGPWEKTVEHLPYDAISAAFSHSLVSILGYLTLIRIPSILWSQDYFKDVLGAEPEEEMDEDTITNLPWTPMISPPSGISPFVVFDPPVKAYDTATTTHGLMYSIGQMNLGMDQELHLQNLRILSSYNTTRALSLFHATAGIRFRGLELSSVLRMVNDRPGPFIVVPWLKEYNDLENRKYLIEPDPEGEYAPAESAVVVDYVGKSRVYRGRIREEHVVVEPIYQKVENFKDITEESGKIPSWLRLVLTKKTEEEEEEEEDDEQGMSSSTTIAARRPPEKQIVVVVRRKGGRKVSLVPTHRKQQQQQHQRRRQRGPGPQVKIKRKQQIRMVIGMRATVKVSEKFVAAEINGRPQQTLYDYAKAYVELNNLGWDIQMPASWKRDMGPHVTLRPSAVQYEGESFRISLLNVNHFVKNKRNSSEVVRWVILNVRLPEKFKCPVNCHISIGQEHYNKDEEASEPDFWN